MTFQLQDFKSLSDHFGTLCINFYLSVFEKTVKVMGKSEDSQNLL